MADTQAFFTPEATSGLRPRRPRRRRRSRTLRFPVRSRRRTPRTTPSTAATSRAPRAIRAGPRAAVLVLPQWNADAGGHVGLCRLLNLAGLSALRLSLPYHDRRMPPELHRADYIVSANVARTRAGVPAGRARRAPGDRVAGGRRATTGSASSGTSLGLVPVPADHGTRTAHPGAGAQPHLPVLRRRRLARHLDRATCAHGLDGHIELDAAARRCGGRSARAGTSTDSRDRQTLLVYALYDLTFPVDLSRELVRQFARRRRAARGRRAAAAATTARARCRSSSSTAGC